MLYSSPGVSRSQSRRSGADLRTSNRPDAYLRAPLGNKSKRQLSNRALFQSPKRPSDYQGYRPVTPDRSGVSAAILLSTLFTAVSSRFIAMDSPNDDNVWLIDRLTGSVYKCQASERGKAACEP